jgi:hypothetical protein
MNVYELTGATLDYWAAKATGREIAWRSTGMVVRFLEGGPTDWRLFSPSTDWAQGGPIIERERILICACIRREYGWTAFPGTPTDEEYAEEEGKGWSNGPTPLIAAMRCFVASKYGETVPEAA